MSDDGGLSDLAMQAILNARASMSRIDDLLATPVDPIKSRDLSEPPVGLSAEEELEWWQARIATLSSEADSKAIVIPAPGMGSGDQKYTSKRIDSDKQYAKGSSRYDTDEIARIEKRMAELKCESKSTSTERQFKF